MNTILIHALLTNRAQKNKGYLSLFDTDLVYSDGSKEKVDEFFPSEEDRASNEQFFTNIDGNHVNAGEMKEADWIISVRSGTLPKLVFHHDGFGYVYDKNGEGSSQDLTMEAMVSLQ